MAKPVIFTIDDDPSVLNSVERDLRSHYGQAYRILSLNQGQAALDYLKKLEQRNEMVALFLVDQRMPEMNGVEFLLRSHQNLSASQTCSADCLCRYTSGDRFDQRSGAGLLPDETLASAGRTSVSCFG